MPRLRDLLKNKLTERELTSIPNSYDQIGTIAVFNKFPDLTIKKQKLIGEILIKNNKNIKTVAVKISKRSGIYRLNKIKIIAGENTKETIHKENNIFVKLDIEKCYFSQRMSHERLRITKQIKKPEKVLVMFSGIGIFPLVISKNSNAKEIYSVEINHKAVDYALDNLKLNKINNIKLYQGNVKKIMPKMKQKFDRIIMPAPKNACNYLNLIKNKIKKNTIIHLYDFCNEKDFPKDSINKIKEYFNKVKILNAVKCGAYSPYVYRVCIDFQVL